MASLRKAACPFSRTEPPHTVLPETSRTRLPSFRGNRQRPRRLLWVAVLGVIVLGLAATAGVLLLTMRGELAAGTRIGGIDVGGLTPEAARARIIEETRDEIARPITLRTTEGDVATSGTTLEAKPRLAKALTAADEVSAWGKLRALVGLGGSKDVELEYDLGRIPLAKLLAGLDKSLGTPARDARVRKTPEEIRLLAADTGYGVDRDALTDRLDTLPEDIQVPLHKTRPEITNREAALAIRDARELFSKRRYVGVGTTVVALNPPALREMVRFVPAKGTIDVRLDRAILGRRLRPIEKLEEPARDARWNTDGKRAVLVPAREGRALDVDRIELSLTRDLDSSVHRVKFDVVQPKLTTEKAESYRITEMVSEFTTYHPCCAGRVTNIHRAAEILDETLIPPGGTFSLNEAMGQRTEERGFVAAPQIFAGRLQDAVGGGVSQMSTTMYNAAFFAGMRIDQHQPHEFYISRYPMGREATVSWGGPEMIWTNDWPAGVLIRTAYTDTSITVRLYSAKLGRRVQTVTSEPCCYEQPQTFTSVNSALAPGETRVLQSAGPAGFTVSYTRKVWAGKKLKRNEKYTWRYKAENAYVEVGPARPKPTKPTKPTKPAKPGPDAGNSGGGDTGADGGTTTPAPAPAPSPPPPTDPPATD